ncbi:unnamed protein product [Pseudo-nitzschia multistriata]|uniref:Uncharacterized protein n=1 Tax=Pseudo-nitzschia multistriata TaxID=183589 RepID=A0A448ZAB3_9STRA|nr:unnamed protein product [Pseudo-nitzschia multistriata]
MMQTMLNKGFRLKAEEEVARIRRIGADTRQKEQDEFDEKRREAERKMEEYRARKKQAALDKEARKGEL